MPLRLSVNYNRRSDRWHLSQEHPVGFLPIMHTYSLSPIDFFDAITVLKVMVQTKHRAVLVYLHAENAVFKMAFIYSRCY